MFVVLAPALLSYSKPFIKTPGFSFTNVLLFIHVPPLKFCKLPVLNTYPLFVKILILLNVPVLFSVSPIVICEPPCASNKPKLSKRHVVVKLPLPAICPPTLFITVPLSTILEPKFVVITPVASLLTVPPNTILIVFPFVNPPALLTYPPLFTLKLKLLFTVAPTLLLMRPLMFTVDVLTSEPPLSLLKTPLHVCVLLLVNVPVFVTVVVFKNVPTLLNAPPLISVLPAAFVKAPPKSTLNVAPVKIFTAALFVKTCGHVNVPALIQNVPLFVKAACCVQVLLLFTILPNAFVNTELLLQVPLFVIVPELLMPPELVN